MPVAREEVEVEEVPEVPPGTLLVAQEQKDKGMPVVKVVQIVAHIVVAAEVVDLVMLVIMLPHHVSTEGLAYNTQFLEVLLIMLAAAEVEVMTVILVEMEVVEMERMELVRMVSLIPAAAVVVVEQT